MTFQSTVAADIALGVPGEMFDDGPHRAQPYMLNSADTTYNVFGRGFTKTTTDGIAAAGNSGGRPFAGILVNPKEHVLRGTTSDSLGAILQVPNGTIATLMTEGQVIVTLPGAAAVGAYVLFDNTTGILSTYTPGSGIPAGKTPAYAVVDRFAVGGAGLAVITLIPSLFYN